MRDFGFRMAVILTLALGMGLHMISLVIGREAFLEHVFTPIVDIFVTIPMLVGAVAGLVAWRRLCLTRLWQRGAYWLLVSYLWLSVGVHLRNLPSGSTQYIEAFPPWYSYPILPVMAAFCAFAMRLRVLR